MDFQRREMGMSDIKLLTESAETMDVPIHFTNFVIIDEVIARYGERKPELN